MVEQSCMYVCSYEPDVIALNEAKTSSSGKVCTFFDGSLPMTFNLTLTLTASLAFLYVSVKSQFSSEKLLPGVAGWPGGRVAGWWPGGPVLNLKIGLS